MAAIEGSRNVTLDVLEQNVAALGARLEISVVKGPKRTPLVTAPRPTPNATPTARTPRPASRATPGAKPAARHRST